MSGGVFEGLWVLIGIVLSVLPLVFALWVLLMLRAVSKDTKILRRQVDDIARHVGAYNRPSDLSR